MHADERGAGSGGGRHHGAGAEEVKAIVERVIMSLAVRSLPDGGISSSFVQQRSSIVALLFELPRE